MDKKPEKKLEKKPEKKPKKKKAPLPPKKGDKVKIIIKPYNKKITKIGVVKDVLTKAKKHTRGHKVRLEDGTIGRVVAK
jgi:uncharacterized repeat protein (TIGR03833 family)